VSETTPTPPDVPASSFWKRRIVDPIVHQMTQGITPERIALAISIGSACALFPIIGTTTILCLIVGVCFKLNQPIMQIINGILTPLHIPVIIGLVKIGEIIFRAPASLFHFRSMNHFFWEHPAQFFARFGMVAVHAIVAWLILAPIWIIVVYSIALPVIREIYRKRETCPSITNDDEPPSHPIP